MRSDEQQRSRSSEYYIPSPDSQTALWLRVCIPHVSHSDPQRILAMRAFI